MVSKTKKLIKFTQMVVKDPSQLLIILVTQTHTSGQRGSRDRHSCQKWA